jgi:hypothetical protein
MVRADFFAGRPCGDDQVDLQEILAALCEAQRELDEWLLAAILDVLDGFGARLLERGNPLHTAYPGAGIPFIANWCRRSNLECVLDEALGTRRHLDEFVPSQRRPDRAYRAFPQGLVVHWMAGNVPTLGFLSLVQGLLTKNANLVKTASDSDNMLADLLELLGKVKNGSPRSGAELVRSLAIARYEHTRMDAGEALSRAADVRIFWGSDESIRALESLPAKPEARSVAFGSKVSLMLIGASVLGMMDMPAIARRVAQDVSIFEQKACASPHTLFLETTDGAIVNAFAEELKRAMQAALRNLPKLPPSPREVCAILELRARYDMFHKAWYSEGTEFSILLDDRFQLGPAIGNRTLFLRAVESLDRVGELVTPQVQSVGILATTEQYERITSLLGGLGVERFVPIGTMTHYESPWNGTFLVQNMVRWVSRAVL